ncbi:MAG: MBL fold metallo-hydrolase [Spirochaetales bacterium]|nr:MBL fold metallo-hydrolase [Spirochaetales bacterium]
MQIEFFGTRGSVPSCGIEYVKYGGNTTCVQIITDNGTKLLIDAGTGIRNVADVSMKDTIRIFLTHSHWDHLQGLPFFGHIYSPIAKFEYYMSAKNYASIKDDLYKQMSGTTFPVDFKSLPCEMSFIKVDNKLKISDDLELEVFENAHPGEASAVKVISGKKVFTFLTDNEIEMLERENRYNDLVEFCKGSDCIAHDAQYSKEEYAKKPGWGHSSINQVIDLLIKVKPQIGIFTHHDPNHTDIQLDEFEELGKQMLKEANVQMLFFGAKENDVIEF